MSLYVPATLRVWPPPALGPAQVKKKTLPPNGKEAMRRSAKEQIFSCARFDLFSGQDIF